MKRLALVLLIDFLIPVAKAQKHNKVQANMEDKWRHVYLSLSSKGVKNKQITSFRSIEVVDYRPDTSRIGLFVTGEVQHDYRLKPSASGVISSFLNEVYANPAASQTLFVVIKKLWFSDFAGKKQLKESSSYLGSRVSFRAEAYLKENGSYIPLAYFDTSITSLRLLRDIAPFRLPALMEMFMEEMHYTNQAKANNKNKRILTFAFVDSVSRKDFSYSIYIADTLHKGVYANFEEFRNNKPSVLNYEVKQDGNSFMTLHLIDEQGKSYYSRKMWGFCDGQQVYVMMDGNLFPAILQNQAWYVYGSKEYKVKNYSAPVFFLFPAAYVIGSLPIGEKVTRRLRFLHLDMETGEIH